jgi:hypothetical protein
VRLYVNVGEGSREGWGEGRKGREKKGKEGREGKGKVRKKIENLGRENHGYA